MANIDRMAERPSNAPGPAWSTLLELLDEAVILYDPSQRCVLAGARVGPLLGVDPALMPGVQRADFLAQLCAHHDLDPALFAADGVHVELSIATPQQRILVWRTRSIPTAQGSVGWIDVVRDATSERRAAELSATIVETSGVDPTTGLHSERRFRHELDREHTRAQRSWDPYSVVRIDIDPPHAPLDGDARDALLRRVGERLRTARREYDVIGRLSSNELILLLPGTDAKAAKIVSKRIVRGLRDGQPVEGEGGGRVTVSAGAAVWAPPSVDTTEDVLLRAAAALGAARLKGPSSVVVDTGEAAVAKDEPSTD